MHGVTLWVTRTVRPSTLKNVPTALQSLAMCEWEGSFDRAIRAAKHALGSNWAATGDAGHAKAYLSRRGNAQP